MVQIVPYGYNTTTNLFVPYEAGDTLKAVDDIKGFANGLATLDGSGKIPTSELPSSVLGAANYQGTWDASTNSPSLSNGGGGSGSKGYYYVVSVAGSTSLDGITSWNIGDWVISTGSAWEKVDNTDAVFSVAGKTGTVTLVGADITDFTSVARTASVADAINDGTTNIAPSQNAVFDALALKLNLSGGTLSGALTFNTGLALRTNTTAGNTLLLQAYSTTGSSYTTFGTLTAGTTPTFDLSDSVTKSGQYIYRAAGTDVPVTDGGTGVSSLTAYAPIFGGTTSTGPVQAGTAGTAGQVLTSNGASAIPTFQDTVASTLFGYVEKTANYTATTSDYTINCTSGSFTITLPTAVGNTGRVFNIKNSGTGVITIDPNSTETIDGSLNAVIGTQWNTVTLQSSGANWVII